MDFLSNEITFGDFDNLTQEDEVYQILYGPRQTESGGVEFPWDSKEYYHESQVRSRDKEMYENQEGNFMTESNPSQQEGGVIFQSSLPVSNEKYSEFTFLQNNMDIQEDDNDNNRSNNQSAKPYERRNKKRRPPGYYDKLKEEIEAERTTEQPEMNVYRNNTEMSTPGGMVRGEFTYTGTSHSDKDTSSKDFVHHVDTNYAQNYASDASVQNQYVANYQTVENVERIADDISHVTLSNDSLSHSHMVHAKHEHYSHPATFHTSPTHPTEVPPHPSVYSQQWTCDSSHMAQPSLHTQHNIQPIPTTSQNTEVSHISYVHMSVNQPQSGSISSEVTHDNVKQEDIESDPNQTNVLDNVESESIVDYASYPPLQPASSNIPVGVSPNKQDNAEEINEGTTVQENSVTPQEETSGEQSGSVWGKPKSWANLFKSDTSSTSSVIYMNNENYVDYPTVGRENEDKNKQVVDMTPVPAIHDSAADIYGEMFCQYRIVHSQVGLQPRGLINRGNWCYINATLQALISCPPFYNLMKKIPVYPPIRRGPTSTPILDSITKFVGEFTPCARTTDRSKGKRPPPELSPGPVFEPTYVYKMLQLLQDTATFKLGKQEDAEEFLSCILDGMHEEMLACMRVHKGETNKEYETNGCLDNSADEDVDADSWEQVGPKKKSVLTRKNDFAVSPLADIFVGYVRSAVFKTTSKESATVEPFFTLKLDIQSEKVSTVREALERMVSKEAVSGFTCSKTNAEMEVTRRLTLEQLPPVLILHLKCFVYDKNGGSQKVIKDVNFTIDLEITKDLLSPNVKGKYLPHQRIYKLFAGRPYSVIKDVVAQLCDVLVEIHMDFPKVLFLPIQGLPLIVYHHGKKATGGHYTTAVFHPAINRWVNFDDSNVKIVPVTQVLQFSAPRVPYLLYYRRVDLH